MKYSILLILLGLFLIYYYVQYDIVLHDSLEHLQTNNEQRKIQVDLQQQLADIGRQLTIKDDPLLDQYLIQIRDPLSIDQQYCLTYVSNLVIGKYKLIHPEDQNMVDDIIRSFFMTTEYDPEEYMNPKQSDVLLIHVCRQLVRSERLPSLTRVLIAQWIINRSYSNQEIEQLYEYIIRVAGDPNESIETRLNANDILNLSNNSRYTTISKKKLEAIRVEEDHNFAPITLPTLIQPIHNPFQPPIGGLRGNNNNTIQRPYNPLDHYNLEEQIRLLGRFQPAEPNVGLLQGKINKLVPRTLFNDSQNVHEASLNKSVIESAQKLIERHRSNGGQFYSLPLRDPNDLPDPRQAKIDKAIHRVMTDAAKFGSTNQFTLHEVYQAVLHLIETNPHRDELYNRLKEELDEMSDKCATGYIARLVSVPQGFINGNPVKIDIGTEIYAKISNHIQKGIADAENSDELMDCFVTEGKKPLIQFIRDHCNSLIPELHREYAQVDTPENIEKGYRESVNRYIDALNK